MGVDILSSLLTQMKVTVACDSFMRSMGWCMAINTSLTKKQAIIWKFRKLVESLHQY